MMVAIILLGKILKKYSLRLIMLIGSICVGGAFMIYSFANTLSHFYIISVFAGVGVACTTLVPISILITNWFKKKRGLALGLAFTGSGFGGLLFNPLTNWIILNYGWRKAYLLLGALVLVIAITIVFFIIADHPSKKGLIPYGMNEETKKSSKTQLTGLSLSEAMKTSYFWLLVTGLLIAGVQLGGIQMHIPAYLTDIGYSSTFAANIVAVFMGVLMVGKLILGIIFDKFGLKGGIIYACMALILCTLALLGAKTVPMTILFAALFGLGNCMGTVAPPLLTAEFFGQKDYGTIVGIVNVFGMFGMAVGPTLSGKIYDAAGSYALAWKIYLVLAVVMLLILLASITKAKKKNQVELQPIEA